MDGYQFQDFADVDFSVAMTEDINSILIDHIDKGVDQEDLTFALWRPSRGEKRYSAILYKILLPVGEERVLQGNVMFTSDYLRRALNEVPEGSGLALIHSHLGPGWQGMSRDDEVAESKRMGGAVAARTGLPVLGLTWGTDGAWSARFWLRLEQHQYERRWASNVRVVGKQLKITNHPTIMPAPMEILSQAATVSVWGGQAQSLIARTHVGIVGLGSVGSVISETLGRIGVQRITLIDHDVIEERNLDRTLGSRPEDIGEMIKKVKIAERGLNTSHTAKKFEVTTIGDSLLTREGLGAALDCDVLISCVDRPLPRHLLNAISKAHLIPVVDGGIMARVTEDGLPLHIDWRIHTVGPSRRCMYCLGALNRGDVSLDMHGLLDSPGYIENLSAEDRERLGNRRNVFAFSLAVASHQVLQLAGLISGFARVGGIGPQHYSAYPGKMSVEETDSCDPDCDIDLITASACDLHSNIKTDARGAIVASSDKTKSRRWLLRFCLIKTLTWRWLRGRR